MKLLNLGSIGKNLTLLVMLVVLPAMAILVYSGMEQRRQSIEIAQGEVQLIASAMSELQKDLAISSKQTLSTLSLLPEIRSLNIAAVRGILKAVLERNPDFQNIAFTDAAGTVLASGISSGAVSLKDRKHVRDAISQKSFAVGVYIMTRVGEQKPAFAFAYPVLETSGELIGVLTLAISLERFSRIHAAATMADKSFVAITDHKGIRLYYYPPNQASNPIGKPIKAQSWNVAQGADQSGRFTSRGSDGVARIFAYDQVRLHPDSPPYIYVWAGVPEADILRPANVVLTRNLLIMLLVMLLTLFISWLLGKQMVILPIKNLVTLVQKFARGDLDMRHEYADDPDEFEMLTDAFYDMAEALSVSQKLLQGNEARFRLIMDSLDALVYVADMNTHEVLFINEYGKEKIGDITGLTCWKTIQQEQTGPCEFCTNKHLLDENGQPGDIYTWEFENKNMKTWYYIRDRAIKWVDGRYVRLEIATNVTEMKRVETSLFQEKERLAVTLRSIGDGVITTNTRGEVVLINDIAEHLTGWQSADAVGHPLSTVFNIIHQESRVTCANPVDRVLSSGENISLEENTVLIAKDGSEKSIADSGAPIKSESGEVIGVVLVFRDISEQLQTAKELTKVKKLESIGVLAGGIAHDFNNILTAILGNIDLSLDATELSGETRTLLLEAEKASHRAQSLTGQLLTFAKGGEPIITTASLVEVVKDSADFVVHGDKIAIHYEFADDLWYVDIDKGQISQVIQNIILNARDAMPDWGNVYVSGGNIYAEDAMPGLEKKYYVKLEITDTGSGIPHDIQEKIFDPYFSTKPDGSGLGLAITHSIVTKHAGKIELSSVPDKGSTFTIYLPASVDDQLEPTPTSKPPLIIAEAKVLIMDDEASIRDVASVMLGRKGHEVVTAVNGTETLELNKQALDEGSPFDLVIMDLTIPGGMGGKKTMQKLLEIDPNARGVVSSGYSHDPVMANFQTFGFSGALVKPYLVTDLIETINQLLA